MNRWARGGLILVVVLVLLVVGYTTALAVVGSATLVNPDRSTDCRTPDVNGWAYEAINYDIADDAVLADRNSDRWKCTAYDGTKAGPAVVTDDGVHIAGWYIPAGNGGGPTVPTIILVHGLNSNKSGMLLAAEPLHESFNLVAFDMRNVGRSTGDRTTGGVLEQKDLRAIIDWVERTKHPAHLGVLGDSLGAATALAEMRDDPRVEAIVLDSMHTRIRYQIESRISLAGLPSYFGTTWAVALASQIRSGVDIQSIDAEDTVLSLGTRPMLLIHGTADKEDPIERTRDFYESALARGADVRLELCPGSGHQTDGMPINVCKDDWATWTTEFFARTLT